MSNKIDNAFKNGTINGYMKSKLLDASKTGMTDDLLDDLIKDAIDASSLGVEKDEDYDIYFFTTNLPNNIFKEKFSVVLDDLKKSELCKYLIDNYKAHKTINIQETIEKWLEKIKKCAYPNIGGKDSKEPYADLVKWSDTFRQIYEVLSTNKNAKRNEAIDYYTKDWDFDEKQKFLNWMKYYEQGNTRKYNVNNINKLAFDINDIPQDILNTRNESGQIFSPVRIKKDRLQTQREKELEKARYIKKQIKSRIDSFKRLLFTFKDILPKTNTDEIIKLIHDLETQIYKLEVTASMEDCIFRTANRIRKFGFSEGAELLEKFAAEQEVIKSLPAGESDEPNLKNAPNINITTIINRLEGVSKILKSRDTIRDLASIDILLNEIGVASYFPELTDAQSHLIEAFGYASNKVEGIIAKLRGSGTHKTTIKQEPIKQKPVEIAPVVPESPPVPEEKQLERGEILTKPVEEVKTEKPKPETKPGT